MSVDLAVTNCTSIAPDGEGGPGAGVAVTDE